MTTPTYRPAENIEHVANALAQKIIRQLYTGKKVLWLVPGGSAIAIAAQAAKAIAAIPHRELTVTLTDERYGPVNHADSNWRQLTEAGFSLPDARLLPVLTGQDRAATTAAFSDTLKRELQTANWAIGLFGMGADGHTAGILPHSPAVAAVRYAEVYDAPNFERITMTPKAIPLLDEAVVYAVGLDKWPALKDLQNDRPIADQPAQILKQIPTLTVYTDYEE
jgi:6-phosphogluconolactonase/glucosamine-6-phosphate isomerase/deaminase